MRPIIKGDWPISEDGKIKFTAHGQAKQFLENNTGHYCYFCEMPVVNVPGVEHIKHQQHHPNLVCHWDNLMLSCQYCNSRKTKSKIKTYNYYWPHKNNTFLIFNYEVDNVFDSKGLPAVNDAQLNDAQKDKAQKTLELYGLNKKENSTGGIDRRFNFRLDAISKALGCKQEYGSIPPAITVDGILRTAQSTGFWSIWATVFKHDIPVLEALMTFKGTDINSSFDADFNPVPRNHSNTIDPL